MRTNSSLIVGAMLAVAIGCGVNADRTNPTGSVLQSGAALARKSPKLAPAFSRVGGFLEQSNGLRVSPGAISRQSHEIAVVLPAASNDLVSIADARRADAFVALTAIGSSARPFTMENGHGVSQDVFPSVDEIVNATASSWESFYVLKGASARSEFAWKISTGPEIVRTDSAPDGSLRFIDARGEVVLAMPIPVAVDSKGEERTATLAFSGDELKLSLDTTGLRFPILLDPTITSWSFVKVESGPAQLFNNGNASYDEDRKRTIMFGGMTGAYGLTSATNEWNGAWLNTSVTAAAAPRCLQSTAYDSARHRTVMFGGLGASYAFLTDTWEFNGSAWVDVSPKVAPASIGPMVFDENRKKIVLFGGDGATWEWNGETWSSVTTATAPSARGNAGFAYDTERRVAVLYGGRSAGAMGTDLADTWEYNGVSWTDKTTGSLGVAHAGATLIYHRDKKRILRVGGQGTITPDAVQEWNGSVWSTSTIPSVPVAPESVVYDSERKAIVLIRQGEVWETTGGVWSQRGSSLAPTSPSYYARGAYAPGLGGVFFHGAVGAATETWIWTGTAWQKKSPAGAVPKNLSRAVYDANANRVLGVDFPGSSTDLWSWSGANWSKLVAPAAPKQIAAGAFDVQRNRLVVFANGPGTQDADETWEWIEATGWKKITTLHAPSPRAISLMVYEPTRKRLILAGGLAQSATGPIPRTDTWEYDGVDWTEIKTAHTPSVASGAMAFDPLRAKAVRLASDNSLWEYDGADWTSLPVSGLVPATPQLFPTAGAELHYDGTRLTLLVSPVSTVEGPSLYRLSANYGACASDADCPNGLLCTDGVCCASRSCNTCETCNGIVPGVCSPVTNRPDPDSCSGTSSCNSKGGCQDANGKACSDNVTCASGNCVDGVCCESTCDGPCEACAQTQKEDGSRDGICGPAKAGTPEATCAISEASTCGLSGLCDGNRACGKYVKDTSCDSNAICTGVGTSAGRVCDGFGTCSANAKTVDCKGYKCVDSLGCGTTCSTSDQCVDGFFCNGGACVAKEGTVCVDDYTVRSADFKSVDCGNYRCRAGSCKNPCATVDDCRDGLVCDFSGQCVEPPALETEGGGCSVGRRPASRLAGWFGIALVVAGVGRRRRENRRRGRDRRGAEI